MAVKIVILRWKRQQHQIIDACENSLMSHWGGSSELPMIFVLEQKCERNVFPF